MNDLTKEAIRRQQKDWEIDLKTYMANSGYSSGGSSAQSDIDQSYGRPKYGNDYLEPDRPLTGRARNYLTGYEGSRCDRIDILPEPDPRLEIDAFMDGHSEGMAAGMTLMEQSMEESRTGINLDKINRVSDDYQKISDEVDGQFFRDFRVEKNGYFSFSNVEIGE